ncbi:ABC transporter ATP-binding protein [Ideonella sp.]|uniref:ABC transporter ATP-binding protein n=1 Tax=Ideonella sp. TaxID=1929293 RepID=UPI0037C0C639
MAHRLEEAKPQQTLTAQGSASAPSAQPFLTLQGVSKAFGATPILRDLDLAVQEGELVCLLGPSGCGKTTLLRILCGIETVDAGSVHLHGQDITALAPAARHFGVVFQSYALFPNLSALDNVAYGLRGLPRERVLQRAAEMLDMVGLTAHARKFPAQLSGGQQQRVALARALAPQPRLLLLDEPLSALDAQVRAAMRSEIRQLQRSLRMSTIMVTHDQDEALAMADRVVLMEGGRIAQDAAPWALYAQPSNRFSAQFVGRMNLWPARVVASDEVRVGAVHLRHQHQPKSPDDAGQATWVGIRPETIEVRPLELSRRRAAAVGLGPEDWLPTNTVEATLSDWTFCGAHVQLQWQVEALGQTLESSMPTPIGGQVPWQRGEQVGLYLPPKALSLLPVEAP